MKKIIVIVILLALAGGAWWVVKKKAPAGPATHLEAVAVEKGDTPDFRKFDIVLFHGKFLSLGHGADDSQSAMFDGGDDSADGVACHCVGFDDSESAFEGHEK